METVLAISPTFQYLSAIDWKWFVEHPDRSLFPLLEYTAPNVPFWPETDILFSYFHRMIARSFPGARQLRDGFSPDFVPMILFSVAATAHSNLLAVIPPPWEGRGRARVSFWTSPSPQERSVVNTLLQQQDHSLCLGWREAYVHLVYGYFQVTYQFLDSFSYLWVELRYCPAGMATVGFAREKLFKVKHKFLFAFRTLWSQFNIELPVLKGTNHESLLFRKVARTKTWYRFSFKITLIS